MNSSKLITIPKLDGKSSGTTLKHLEYIFIFSQMLKNISELLSSDDKDEKKYVVFYKICIIGEIVSKQQTLSPKLPEEIRSLFPPDILGVLQDIRDNYIVHSAFHISENENFIYNLLKKEAKKFNSLGDYANEICLINLSNIICDFMIKLDELDVKSFAKFNNAVKKIKEFIDVFNKTIEITSDGEMKEYYLDISRLVSKRHKEISTILDRKTGKEIDAIISIREKKYYHEEKLTIIEKSDHIKLAEIKNLILCDFLSDILNKLKEKNDESKFDGLLKKHCSALNEVNDNFLLPEFQLSLSNTKIKEEMWYTTRWHVIMTCSFFEQKEKKQGGQQSINLIKFKQQVVHDFMNSGFKQEIQKIAYFLNNELKNHISAKKQKINDVRLPQQTYNR